MSTSVSFADYRTALTTCGARMPAVTSLLGRLPIAMIGLALLLYVQRMTQSFAAAGLASAATLAGVACGSVLQGRLMDAFGPSRPLVVATGLFSVLTGTGVTAIELGAAIPVVVALSFGIGITQPTVASASRALWGRLLPPGSARTAAFSYEAISMEVFFILGPGLAGLLVAMPWAGTGVVAGAGCMIVGALGFAATPAVRSWRPRTGERSGGSLLGALATPGMRTVALAALGFGLIIGFVEVAVPAAATVAGHATAGGLLLSLWSVTSVAAGVLYNLRPWPAEMRLRLPALLCGFAVLVTLLAAPGTLLGLCLAMLLAGSFITPQSTAHSTAIELAAPSGTAAEAFGWVITSVTLGAAAGQSVSGQLVELSGPPTAFVVAGAAGLALAFALWLRRGTLLPTRPEVAVSRTA